MSPSKNEVRSLAPKKELGQVFTPAHVAEFMVGLARKTALEWVIEPSCGEGVFVAPLLKAGAGRIDCFEVDRALEAKIRFPVRFESFLSAEITPGASLVIGNPPYVRWKHLPDSLKTDLQRCPAWQTHCNSLSDYLYPFIIRSIDLLRPQGELIFITPDYWLKSKHAAGLRNYILRSCVVESVHHFGESQIFKGVASSIIIFKLVKKWPGETKKTVIHKWKGGRAVPAEALYKAENFSTHEASPFKENAEWQLGHVDDVLRANTLEEACATVSDSLLPTDRVHSTIGEVCDIGNGLVSGLDKAFQVPPDKPLTPEEKAALIRVAKAKHLTQYRIEDTIPYFFVKEGLYSQAQFEARFPNIKALLEPYEGDLNQRYQYGRSIGYWEWVFPRSLALFEKDVGKIFVPCKERITNKDFVRFSYAKPGIFPTQDVTAIVPKPETRESVYYILALLNSRQMFDWMLHKGVLKGGILEFSEAPISRLPFKRIHWSDLKMVGLHDQIVELSRKHVEGGEEGLQNKIQTLVDALLAC